MHRRIRFAAFRLAWEQGADGIEGDFILSSDGRIVCIHDDDTKRVAGIERVVKRRPTRSCSRSTLALEGRALARERIPSLDDVLAIVPAGKKIVIELKAGPEIVAPLAEVLQRAAIAHRRDLDHQSGGRDDRRMQAATAPRQVPLAQRLQAGRRRPLAADGGRGDCDDSPTRGATASARKRSRSTLTPISCAGCERPASASSTCGRSTIRRLLGSTSGSAPGASPRIGPKSCGPSWRTSIR